MNGIQTEKDYNTGMILYPYERVREYLSSISVYYKGHEKIFPSYRV